MTQPNFITFLGDLTTAYQRAEQQIKLKSLQDGIPKQLAILITIVSAFAVGYLAHKNTNPTFLGGGIAAGLIFSHIDPTFGKLPSLKKGALLPLDQKGSFALQKVYLVSALLGKQYSLPTGLFLGNAVYHFAKNSL